LIFCGDLQSENVELTKLVLSANSAWKLGGAIAMEQSSNLTVDGFVMPSLSFAFRSNDQKNHVKPLKC
jgi:hypothetical protein